jgi:hypothetical protein
MKVDYKGKTARLYRWFYITKEIPTDGCLYIKGACFAWLLGLFALILRLPVEVVSFFDKDFKEDVGSDYKVSVMMWLALGLVVCFISTFFIPFTGFQRHNSWYVFQTLGIGIWMMGILGVIIYGCVKAYEYYEDRTLYREPKQWLIVEGYKSFKEKYCPKVEVFNKE